MDSSIQNLEIVIAEECVVKAIEKYFPSGTISIGSLLRKLPFMLMDLVELTKTPWSLDFHIADDPEILVMLKEDSDKPGSQRLGISYVTRASAGRKHAVQVLTKVFMEDKWIKMPVERSTVILDKEHASFEYSKKLKVASNQSYHVAVFTMKPKPRGWMQKTSAFFRRMFFHSSNTVEGYRVVEAIPRRKKVR